ncbi:MAG: ribosome recycling factor [Candidatus Latescibacteria bacterium]|jgi:ribosome recycling factor|nr:ribosome recycling factor [Candidatus Latescibacterota bacterium]MBT4141241.1 ribosome recycling factor [Candidatus Latescibacterota bacterium]MBT5832579.1 ribosome recycling factor [Candidatus Latescibacterota bacterium]
MVNDILSEAKGDMHKAVDALHHEMDTVRTGRASAHLLDQLRVDYYGSQVPINQVANVGAPEPRLITIAPWDKTSIPLIEKAIQESKLGLTPSNDGTLIRLPIPALTEDRRKELVKVVRQYAEESRVSVRNHRRDANELLKEGQKDGEIPEDDAKRASDQVQELTNDFTKQIDNVLKAKEEEIMEV